MDQNKNNLTNIPKEIYIPNDAIWIYQHDFYDAPGVYGNTNIFPNHYAWMLEIIKFCKSNKVKFIIKKHPNNRKGSEECLKRFIKKYSLSDNLLEKDLNLTQIKTFKPKCICSVYGSVIPEAAFMGIPVITCGPHPFEAEKISFNAKNIFSFNKYLLKANKNLLEAIDTKKVISSFAVSKFISKKEYPNIKNVSFADINEDLWQQIFNNKRYPINVWERLEVINNKKNEKNYLILL